MKVRPFQDTDADALYRIYLEPDVMANNAYLPSMSRSDFDALLNHMAHNFVACDDDGTVMGHLCIRNAAKPRIKHIASFGLAVSSSCRRRGVARLLMQHLLDFCFNWLNVVRIELSVHANNDGAIAWDHSFGFELEGRQRQAVYVNGLYLDTLSMALLHPKGQ